MRIQPVAIAVVAVLFVGSNGIAQQGPNPESVKKESVSTLNSIVTRALVIIPGNRPLHDELEIQDYQLEDIKQLRYDFQRKMTEASKTMASAGGRTRQEKLRELVEELDEGLSESLLPHQTKRLREIAYQSFGVSPTTGSMNVVSLLSHRSLRDALGLSQAEIAALRKESKAEEKRLRKEIANLRRESQERLLGRLTAEQREKLDQMIGELFDFRGYAPSSGGQFRRLGDDH